MKITWCGQSYFKIKCQNIELIIDPYNSSIGIIPPKIKSDVVLITHNHSDHNNKDFLSNNTIVIDGPGEYEINGTFIYGKEAYHDNEDGAQRGIITMYKIEDEKLKLAHLSDIGQKILSQDQLEFLNDVDILLIPIGGKYTINSKEAIKLINDIEPRVIIPMHYKIPGLKIDIETADDFIKEIGLNPEITDEYKISKNDLPADEIKLVILKRQ